MVKSPWIFWTKAKQKSAEQSACRTVKPLHAVSFLDCGDMVAPMLVMSVPT